MSLTERLTQPLTVGLPQPKSQPIWDVRSRRVPARRRQLADTLIDCIRLADRILVAHRIGDWIPEPDLNRNSNPNRDRIAHTHVTAIAHPGALERHHPIQRQGRCI